MFRVKVDAVYWLFFQGCICVKSHIPKLPVYTEYEEKMLLVNAALPTRTCNPSLAGLFVLLWCIDYVFLRMIFPSRNGKLEI